MSTYTCHLYSLEGTWQHPKDRLLLVQVPVDFTGTWEENNYRAGTAGDAVEQCRDPGKRAAPGAARNGYSLPLVNDGEDTSWGEDVDNQAYRMNKAGIFLMCWCDYMLGACAWDRRIYRTPAGYLRVLGPYDDHVYEATRGKSFRIFDLTGVGLSSDQTLMVSPFCGHEIGLRGFGPRFGRSVTLPDRAVIPSVIDNKGSPVPFSYAGARSSPAALLRDAFDESGERIGHSYLQTAPHGSSFEWEGMVQAVPNVYALCHCQYDVENWLRSYARRRQPLDACDAPSGFRISAGVVHIVGPYKDQGYDVVRGVSTRIGTEFSYLGGVNHSAPLLEGYRIEMTYPGDLDPDIRTRNGEPMPRLSRRRLVRDLMALQYACPGFEVAKGVPQQGVAESPNGIQFYWGRWPITAEPYDYKLCWCGNEAPWNYTAASGAGRLGVMEGSEPAHALGLYQGSTSGYNLQCQNSTDFSTEVGEISVMGPGRTTPRTSASTASGGTTAPCGSRACSSRTGTR
jgi:hypothetical protein